MNEETKKAVEYGCKKHHGEHPFYYKQTVGWFVTWCHEVYNEKETYPKRW